MTDTAAIAFVALGVSLATLFFGTVVLSGYVLRGIHNAGRTFSGILEPRSADELEEAFGSPEAFVRELRSGEPVDTVETPFPRASSYPIREA